MFGCHRKLAWCGRFALGMLAMVFVNLIPLALTWHTYYTDGMECFGFPLTFFERGGVGYHENFWLDWLIIDAVVATMIAIGFANLTRDGFRAALRRLGTWDHSVDCSANDTTN